jgi:hypothetical protein
MRICRRGGQRRCKLALAPEEAERLYFAVKTGMFAKFGIVDAKSIDIPVQGRQGPCGHSFVEIVSRGKIRVACGGQWSPKCKLPPEEEGCLFIGDGARNLDQGFQISKEWFNFLVQSGAYHIDLSGVRPLQ